MNLLPIKRRSCCVLVALAAGCFVAGSAVADTITGTGWKGTGGANWSTSTNWNATPPKTDGTGDRNLQFGLAYKAAGGTATTSNNDLVNWHGYRITFQDSNAAGTAADGSSANDTAFTITGNAFGLFDFGGTDPKIQNDSFLTQTFSLSGTLTLDGTNGTGNAQINPVNGSLVFNNTVDIGGTTKLTIFGGNANSVTFAGGITSSGNSGNNSFQIGTNADGRTPTVIFTGTSSSYAGSTFVNAGTLQLGSTGGSPVNGGLGATTIFLGDDNAGGGNTPTAQLTIAGAGNQTISNPITTRSGSGGLKKLSTVYTGTDTLSGGMTLNVALTLDTGTGSTLNESGAVTGAGLLTKTGAGTLTLSSASNSLSGGLTTSNGLFTVGSGGQLSVTAGTITIGSASAGNDLTIDGTLINSGSWMASGSWSANTTWTVSGTGTYVHNNTGGISTPMDRLTLASGSTFTYRGSSTLTPSTSFAGRTYSNLSFDSTSGSWTASASGSTALTVNGNLTVGSGVIFALGSFTGANNFNGNVTVSGSMTGPGSFTIASGKQLLVNNGASIVLNASPAQTITIASTGTAQILGTGTVSNAGNFTLSSGSNFITSNATGLDGAITVTGTKSFSTGANYEFQGAATGATLPATVNNLTINRSSGNVALNGTGTTQTISNTLNVFSGNLDASGTRINISVAGTGNSVVMRGGTQINSNAVLSLTGASGGDVIFDSVNNGTATIAGSINLGGVTRAFNVGNGSAVTDMSVSGVISNGSLTKSGLGTLELAGTSPNTYTGQTTISQGELDLNKTGGTAIAGNVTVNGGTLKWSTGAAANQVASSKNILLSSGTVDLNGAQQTLNDFTNSGGTFRTGTGTLTGTGNSMTWSGGINTINAGGTVNDPHVTISGGTNTIESTGTLTLNTGNGLVMSGGDITLNAGTTATNGGKILLMGSSTNNITASAGTTSNISSSSQTNAGLVDLANSARTIFTDTGATLNVSANLTSSGSLTKTGTGTLNLTGGNTYTGTTTVSAGQMFVNGSTSSSSAVTVSNSGTVLGGSGTIGGSVSIGASARLAAGASGDGSTAILQTGALSLTDSTSIYSVDLNNTTAGSGYDQVIASSIALNNATLSLAVGALNVGDQFVIGINSGAGSDGQFNGLAEGASFNQGIDAFTISYMYNADGGVTGNDILLTLVAVPEPGTYAVGALVAALLLISQPRRIARRMRALAR